MFSKLLQKQFSHHNGIAVVEFTIVRHRAGVTTRGETDTNSQLCAPGVTLPQSQLSVTYLWQTWLKPASPVIGHWKLLMKLSQKQIRQHLLMAIHDKPCMFVCAYLFDCVYVCVDVLVLQKCVHIFLCCFLLFIYFFSFCCFVQKNLHISTQTGFPLSCIRSQQHEAE